MDGKVVRTACGNNDNKLWTDTFEVHEFAGRNAHLEIVDEAAEGWGCIGVDHIVLTDEGEEIRLTDEAELRISLA